ELDDAERECGHGSESVHLHDERGSNQRIEGHDVSPDVALRGGTLRAEATSTLVVRRQAAAGTQLPWRPKGTRPASSTIATGPRSPSPAAIRRPPAHLPRAARTSARRWHPHAAAGRVCACRS